MRNLVLGVSMLLAAGTLAGQAPDQTVRMKTNLGDIDVTLLPSVAPLTVANFLRYMERGAYNNTIFHRLVPGFIVQVGGYTLNGNNFDKIPSDAPVRNEYNLSNIRGTVAMAKLGNNPNSATNEFFFNLADNSSNLNNQNGGFTVFGRVANAASQTVVDRIASQPVPGIFNQPFNEMPLFNWRGGNATAANIIVIQSMTLVDAPPPPPPPTISSGGVIVANAFGGGTTVSAGSYIEIYGTALAGKSRGWEGSDFTGGQIAPNVLEQVRVHINSVPAYVSYVSPTQVNVQVPEGIPTGDAIPLVLTYDGKQSAPILLTVKDYAGGLLAPASFKVGDVQYVAAQHHGTQNFVSGGNIPNIPAAPAIPGGTITLYGTGFGPITPNFPALAGRVASGQTALSNPVSIKIGNADARILYAGLAPGLVGVYQFNVVVPENAAPGDQPLTVTQGGTPIAQKLFLTVRAAN